MRAGYFNDILFIVCITVHVTIINIISIYLSVNKHVSKLDKNLHKYPPKI